MSTATSFTALRVLTVILILLTGFDFARAQTYPPDFGQVLVSNGINNPTVMAFAPDGRIFVAQQAGALRVIKNNSLLPTPFISLTVSASGERGLLGIALDPDFPSNNYIYLYYTVPGSPAHNRISRFTANGDVVLAGSESIVLELDPLSSATNHNGGAMHFGKDGKLYVAIGENATSSHAQDLDTYHGKLLRINKDGTVPGGNPFTSGSEQRRRVWSYGLRNPYTFSIHPTTGRILVNDVGQSAWEEINDATTGGKNFGWPTTSGMFVQANHPNLTNPIYAYEHGSGDGRGCAIVGGTFFSPTTTNYPATYVERYFFQDLCNDWINTLDLSAAPVRASFATAISGDGLAITTGIDGNLYYLSRTNDALYKIVYNNTTAPFLTNQPVNLTVAEGQPATLSVTALGSTPLSYQWKKNGTDIPGAINSMLTFASASLADNGDYSVVVSNATGSETSATATLTVLENELPVAEILLPATGATYVAGTTINFSGSGTDAEDGELAADAFGWQIDFHHDTHKHDQPAIDGVKQGTFLVPNEGETSHNVWYRIILTVTDAQGLIGKDSVDVHPRKSTLRFNTSPSGLKITVDGQPFVAPDSVISVEGMLRTIGSVSPQEKDGITYHFLSWSNRGDEIQVITVPEDDITLTARYSHVVATELDLYNNKVSIYPNPSKQGVVTINLPSEKSQTIRIQMVDLMSREVASHSADVDAGDNELHFHYGKVQTGMYSVLIEMPDKTISRRLVVSD
jgi:glucose/arabinose dehydrogenase